MSFPFTVQGFQNSFGASSGLGRMSTGISKEPQFDTREDAGIAPYQKIPSFQKTLARDQREEPRETPALAVDAPLLCDGFIGYHNTWPASGRHLLAPLFGAFPQNLPSLSLIALLLSFPTKSELIETFPPPPHIDLIEVMGYNLCAVRSCATADGSLKREEHRSSRQSLTVLCLVGKREQSYRPQIRQEIKARITG